MNNKKMAQFITELRKEKKLTQKDLAEHLGITDKAVSKWERGLSCPDISLLPELSQLLGVTTGELLNGEKAQPPAPEVETTVETPLQYAGSTAKNIATRSKRWKTAAITFAALLLSILVLIGCNWAIENSTQWSILPMFPNVLIWLVIILALFVMGKNKISSLLLCLFIIFMTTFFYSSLNQATTRDISRYGKFNGFTREYIPYYTIIIVMFVVSLAVTMISIAIQNKKISGDWVFLLAASAVTIIIITMLTVSSIMDYVDIHGLGVNPKFTILLMLTFLMNSISLALLAKRHGNSFTRSLV